MPDIKNIVFDFGGVLLQIDYRLTTQRLRELLDVTFDFQHLPQPALQLLKDYETGRIGTESFLWALQHMSAGDIPDPRLLIDAWNAMLIGWNRSHFELLRSLREKYQVYLLSNTNALHLEWVYQDLKINHQIDEFDSQFFTQTFYSHLIGMRKPDTSTYQNVAKIAGLEPSKTLFIDDLAPNTEGAARAGWQTYLHDPSDDLPSIIKDHLGLL
jgi:FMN phosphatase YigB (HAD superfamily)